MNRRDFLRVTLPPLMCFYSLVFPQPLPYHIFSTALLIYWSDMSVLARWWELYWNPSLRELYPHRQFRLEKAFMFALHQANIFHSRRWRGKYTLPEEIWEEILLWAIHAHAPIDIDYNTSFRTSIPDPLIPDASHYFYGGHKFQTELPRDYTTAEKWGKQLQLVSPLWRDIMRRQRPSWVIIQSDKSTLGRPRIHLHREIRRVDFRIDDPDLVLYPESVTTEQDKWNLSVILPNLSVVSVKTEERTEQSVYNQLSTAVFRHSPKFVAADRFILDTYAPVTRLVLAGIESSFSKITSLTLDVMKISGELHLEQVETLVVKTTRDVDMRGWNLPRLQHFALRSSDGYQHLYSRNLLPSTHRLLRTLHLDRDQALVADAEFWTNHPHLEEMGFSASKFQLVDSPPLDHPLARIFFWEAFASDGCRGMDLEHTKSIVTRIPRLRMVRAPMVYPVLSREDCYTKEWMDLARMQKQQGITWYSIGGHEIEPVHKMIWRDERGWEKWRLHAFVISIALLLLTLLPVVRAFATSIYGLVTVAYVLYGLFLLWDVYWV